MKWIVTMIVLVAVLVPTAYATGQAFDPRVPALKRQVAALTARVTQQEQEISTVGSLATRVQVFARCLAANQQPIARYTADVAYGFQGGQYYKLTFLDYTHGDAAHGYVPFPRQPCQAP